MSRQTLLRGVWVKLNPWSAVSYNQQVVFWSQKRNIPRTTGFMSEVSIFQTCLKPIISRALVWASKNIFFKMATLMKNLHKNLPPHMNRLCKHKAYIFCVSDTAVIHWTINSRKKKILEYFAPHLTTKSKVFYIIIFFHDTSQVEMNSLKGFHMPAFYELVFTPKWSKHFSLAVLK